MSMGRFNNETLLKIARMTSRDVKTCLFHPGLHIKLGNDVPSDYLLHSHGIDGP